MDTFTFLIALMMLAFSIQFNQIWIGLGIMIILMVTSRSFMKTLLILAASIGMVLIRGPSFNDYLPFMIFGLIVVALAMGVTEKPQEGGGGMEGLGGLEGLAGLGGLGGMH